MGRVFFICKQGPSNVKIDKLSSRGLKTMIVFFLTLLSITLFRME